MQKIPNVRKVRDAIRKVGLISSPTTSSLAAEALIELVRSGELLIIADYLDSVLNRSPDAYIKRSDALRGVPRHMVQIDYPKSGIEFPFGDYLPIFFGSVSDHE